MKDLNCWETKIVPCCYSDRLVTKLLLLNETKKQKVDILEIKKAIYYAKKYHGSQMRQSGQPYYSHPLEVAYNIADHVFKTDILITSILHDTVEDTKLTKDMISYIFGLVIAEQVEGLTRVKTDRKISSAEIVDLLWIQRQENLLLIKYFDRLHNLQTINVKSPEKISKIITETLEQFISLEIYFKSIIPNLFNVDDDIMALCYQQLPIKQQRWSQGLMEYCEDHLQLPSPVFQNE